MKRFITMIVAVCAFFAVSAQNPMVTLSHNGELSFFTNIGAFKAAYDAAENGDILYLSEGNFFIDGDNMTIEKRLSIVGSGYSSYILGKLTIKLADNPEAKMDAPLFDGVRMNTLAFYNNANSSKTNEAMGETEIRRCWIDKLLSVSYGGTDLKIDQCFIENITYDTGSNNVLLKNSKFHSSGNYSYNLTAMNCNIIDPNYYPRKTISCIISSSSIPDGANGATIINSLMNQLTTDSRVKIIDCYITDQEGVTLLDENLECVIDLNGYRGQDGTEVGIHGGETPFSENPSVPTVDSANSTVEYDAASNKLKVNITVKAD